MWSQKIKQITSFLLIFSLLFSFTLRIPAEIFFGSQAFAGDKEFYNLVSIIVDEESYDDIKTKLVRYSRDIQGNLENTRVVILPTPSDASVLDIASLNESLFFEGYKAHKDVDYESRLIGTVLVGKIPVPVVFDGADSARSILPYVDFEDKAYIFDHEFGKYNKSEQAETKLSPEIWHGVISPNTGDAGDDIDAIADYFDKNHDFYTGQGVFDQAKGVIDGQDTPAGEDYEPYVFYYDAFRENEALQYQKYTGYEMYLQNIEDITYNRYSKELAKKVSEQVLGVQNADMQDLLTAVDPDFDLSGIDNSLNVDASSDILTRYITDNSTKKFLEIFNGSSLGEMRKHVYNAGRYNDGGARVNMDMPPFLISVLDQVNAEIIKNVNTKFETQITDIVQNGLSRKIAIPQEKSMSSETTGPEGSKECSSMQRGFYYGTIAQDVSSAKDCSIYRGSVANGGILVEASRGLNIEKTDEDIALCGASLSAGSTGVNSGLQGYWGGHSPVGLSLGDAGQFDLNLRYDEPRAAIRPLFDIAGSKETSNLQQVPSPLDCLNQGVYIETSRGEMKTQGGGENAQESCEVVFQVPVLGKRADEWSCRTVNPTSPLSALETYNIGSHTTTEVEDGEICETTSVFLDGAELMSNRELCRNTGSDECSCKERDIDIRYKSIDSYILHTSPTNEEFGIQTQSLFSPSLPIDRERYIDFIAASGGDASDNFGYRRIDFPQMFRIVAESGEEMNLESIQEKLKIYLDEKSAQINDVIDQSKPENLSGKQQLLYDSLSTGEYPSEKVDLYKTLQDTPLEVLDIQNQTKEISYLDTLVFALFWNNLDSVSSKYQFIFQEYLSNEFEGNDFGFHLPKSKKSYEIAYMAAPGDAQNMYIKLDPELKGTHPYADIISQNIALQTTINVGNVGNPNSGESDFACSPPDGVPIFEWIPAVICWLTDMLPPTISFSQGSCGDETVLLSEEEEAEIRACSIDKNKNGVSDCIEQKITGGSLKLLSDAGKYLYNSSGVLISEIFTAEGKLANFDNGSYISHHLSKVVIPTDSEQVFEESNSTVIYDRDVPELASAEARALAAKYISFSELEMRAQRGGTKMFFYTKGKDANIYFESSLQTTDAQGNLVVDLESNLLELQIRGDRMDISSYKIEGASDYIADSAVIASHEANICVVDGSESTLQQSVIEADTLSQAKEKLLLLIQNFSQAGNNLGLNYPLSIELIYNNKRVFYQDNLNSETLQSVYPLLNLSNAGSYEAHIRDNDGFHSYRVFDVLPESATKIETRLGANIMETGGNISTHIISILDRYDNAATGEIYTIELSLDGGGLVFDDNREEYIEYQVLEGYKAFRLKSTARDSINTLNVRVKDISGNLIAEESHSLRTIEDIKMDFSLAGASPKVGGESYSYDVTFTDTQGNLLTNLNSRVYFTINSIYGQTLTPYVPVVGGKAQVSFVSSTLAGKNIDVELQLEGGNDIYSKSISILPESAIKIDLKLSSDKIEASQDETAILEATLKDRYNNDVFTDSSTSLSLDIHEKSQDIIGVDVSEKIVKGGKTQFQISGTDIPGLGYFKVTATPDLSQNSFELIGQAPFEKEDLNIPTMQNAQNELTEKGEKFYKIFSGSKYISKFVSRELLTESQAYNDLPKVLQKQVLDFWSVTNSLTVSGLGENAGSIETFFFWDSDDIAGNSYNSMYSVLLGAPYGDISKENYLAGEILFDRDNSALAVSSLLNTPYIFYDSVSFEDNGHASIHQNGDITQDIELVSRFDAEGRLLLDIHNNALENYIGRAYYNLTDTSDIDLIVDEDAGYTIEARGDDTMIISPLGQVVFEARKSGRFERHSGLSTRVDTDYIGEGIMLDLIMGAQMIGQLHIVADLKTNVTRDENILSNKLSSLDDTIIVHLTSNAYSSRKAYVDADTDTLKLYYQDPFASKYVLDDFHNNDSLGLESSLDESGIGWSDSNTMLLSFAAGESVGESSQHFHSFSLINLGDPVASLKPLQETFQNSSVEKSFDATLGEIVADTDGLIGYRVLDYNSDDRSDLVTIHKDGYVDLYENDEVEGGFIFQRNLVFAADGGSVRLLQTGDFTGDGYDDIFFVTSKGKPALYNNHEKDFYRYEIAEQMSLSGAIIQAEAYDMDDDGKDDIVTLDDAGEVHIFYGNGTAQQPEFTKKFIGDGYAISLSDATTSHGGGVYYDGLIQLPTDKAENILLNSQEYLAQLNESLKDGEEGENPEFIDESLVERYLYMSLPYVPTDYDDPLSDQEVVEQALGSDPSVSEFLNNYGDYSSYSGLDHSDNQNTYFLRSEYAENQGLEIRKTYTDTTPPNLQTGDSVYYDISIKNTGNSRKDNIAYVDSIPKYFHFANKDVTILSQDNLVVPRRAGIDQYEIVLDHFFLDPGEEMIVRYELTTLALSYGYMQVGLYEDGEVGDDSYGDIILKDDEKNCGKTADIYRSTANRAYSAGTTTPSCDSADINVGNSFPELTDVDGNGVPDYLDSILDAESGSAGEQDDGSQDRSDDMQRVVDYGEKIRAELGLDSDGDGIPDRDDSMDDTNGLTDFMDKLDEANEKIDEISEDIDVLIQGLSCGFGGGSCIASPLNWAPMAPGQDPTLYGKPIGDGLKVGEGTPIFSALTGRQTSCGHSPCCLPSVYPATSATFIPGPTCGGSGAGGSRGINSPTNFVRMYATPTLTGGFGIALCLGGPASVAGNANPKGVYPIVPGGNCIVAAVPLLGCEGGEGDPGVLGYPYPGDGFGVIHANCDGDQSNDLHTPEELETDFVLDYLEYLKTGNQPDGMYEKYVDAFSTLSESGGANYSLPSEPLINIGAGGDSSMSSSVSIDSSARGVFVFEDVQQIKNKRVSAFPGFMMDWVERQLDEVTSKLTNPPKVSVILPDFGGIFDGGFEGFGDGLAESFEAGKNNANSKRDTFQNNIDSLKSQKSQLDCQGKDAFTCGTINLKIASFSGKKYAESGQEKLSGITQVYEFLGNIPLIDFETETIPVNIPWIEPTEIDKVLFDWEQAKDQWEGEVRSKAAAWTVGVACVGTQAEIARCQSENAIKEKAYADVNQYTASLEKNIQTLHEYKELPDKLKKVLNIKEVWLEQILCNVDAIASLTGDWLHTNGKRFKAWVELFVLMKAILKSWQVFIDVFTGYEAECHECKNERDDLQDFTFQLISAVIPSAPIIEFPKWPDIILDLHNIRAGLTVYMPDFDINLRPVVLPNFPTLTLPETPSLGFSLPPLPQLPTFEIPELPDMNTLPSVELPNLPPPPKLPKLFGSVEGVLNIMKLVTKAMCILKGSPFVPEWRAGDQIAFLTERNGYLPTDFIDVQPPSFSYSAISAIKVSTYVNLEFETDYVIEAVRNITAPLDKISNNIAKSINLSISDINLSEAGPSDINLDINAPSDDSNNLDIDIKVDGETLKDISLAPLDENPEGILFIAGLFSSKFVELITYMGNNADVTLTNNEFKQYVGSQLASESVSGNPRTQELQDIWSEVFALSYSAEDKFIEELKDNNKKKFQSLRDVITTELEYSQQQRESLDNIGEPDFVIQVAAETSGRIESYNTILEPYNLKTLESAIALVSDEPTQEQKQSQQIQEQGEVLMNQVRGGLQAYNNNLLSAQSDTNSGADAGGGSCHSSSAYQYVYEGIYVLEDGKNYKLFDYTEALRGDEELTLGDLDNDGDDDVLYLMDGKLYFKENTKVKAEKQYLSLPPLILDADENIFYNGETYHEAINGFTEASVSDGAINIEFQGSTNAEIKNYRIGYHTIVDRYLDESDSFIPTDVQTHIVDAIADIDAIAPIQQGPEYSISKHLATLSYAGGMNGIKLTNEKLVNLRDQLEDNVLVTLTSGTRIYSSDDDFKIRYQVGEGEEKTLKVPQYSSLAFSSPAKILSLSGNAYVSLGISQDIEDTDVIDYIGMPLLPGAEIEFHGNTDLLDASSHIDIRYYDGAELQMDMRDIKGYTLYDVGDTYDREYKVRLELANDFYYARIQGFQKGVDSTLSKQILLAPQIYSDTLAPQIGLTQKIRIPVYQSQKIDLTAYIYEDGGFAGISDVRVDFDLGVDSDGDGDAKNDANTTNISITQTPAKIEIEFGPYDSIFEKNILIAIEDDNGNIGTREVGFEVYPPKPSISDIQDNTIIGVIDENLLDEPVRLYRYRGGAIEKLQAADGSDLIQTDDSGNYGFETVENSDGLSLSYSGSVVANIDEYTGRIDTLSALINTKVLASNDPLNNSVYPEIQVLRLATPIFRQFMKIPEGEVSYVSNFNTLEDTGIYAKLLNQDEYASFRVPLGVTYNPGSISVYLSSDAAKTPVMTIFKDGRINIDRDNYKLVYRTLGEDASLVLVDRTSGEDVAQVVYHMNASYVLR